MGPTCTWRIASVAGACSATLGITLPLLLDDGLLNFNNQYLRIADFERRISRSEYQIREGARVGRLLSHRAALDPLLYGSFTNLLLCHGYMCRFVIEDRLCVAPISLTFSDSLERYLSTTRQQDSSRRAYGRLPNLQLRMKQGGG